MTTKTLAKKAAALALTKKARDVRIMDLRKVTDMSDFFVVCSGDSDVQVKAIADAILDGMEQLGNGAWHCEGLTQRQWVLLDFVDVVVHIFHKDARRFYGLEKLWGDAVVETVADEEESPRTARPVPRKRATATAKAG